MAQRLRTSGSCISHTDAASCDALLRDAASCDALLRDAASCDALLRDAASCDALLRDAASQADSASAQKLGIMSLKGNRDDSKMTRVCTDKRSCF